LAWPNSGVVDGMRAEACPSSQAGIFLVLFVSGVSSRKAGTKKNLRS
jgi:hypothetical protein